MSRLLIQGGVPLRGEVVISGAKNAALPLLAATLMTEAPMRLQNIPQLRDVSVMIMLLEAMGVTVKKQKAGTDLDICAKTLNTECAPRRLVERTRASFLVLGPLLAARGYAEVPLPGGCAIGARPVNEHLQGLAALGADLQIMDGVVIAWAKNGLRGGRVVFDTPTVTGTENVLMAATLATGRTLIENAAKEPEVVDLANCLNAMGAHIQGAGSARLMVDGVQSLQGIQYRVMPDRIEAGSYLIAAAATAGCVQLSGAMPDTLTEVLAKLDQAGASIMLTDRHISIDMRGCKPRSVDIDTAPYPGFPTDLQPQFMVLNAVADGSARMTENIFENRLMHVQPLQSMGADVKMETSDSILVKGVKNLRASSVQATDLRASFGLVIAAMAARGTTLIEHVDYIDRGYENVDQKLAALGADVRRLQAEEQALEA